jgi:hypothetical protein
VIAKSYHALPNLHNAAIGPRAYTGDPDRLQPGAAHDDTANFR